MRVRSCSRLVDRRIDRAGVVQDAAVLDGTPDATASPQASAMPAPLAAAADDRRARSPIAYARRRPAPRSAPGRRRARSRHARARERRATRSPRVFEAGDLSGPPRAPEVNTAGLEAARKATELRLAIDLVADAHARRAPRHAASCSRPTPSSARAPIATATSSCGPARRRTGRSHRARCARSSANAASTSRPSRRPSRREGRRSAGASASARARWRSRRAPRRPRSRSASSTALGEGGILLCRLLLDLMNAPPSSTPSAATASSRCAPSSAGRRAARSASSSRAS